jgi:hypothetical protein
VNLYEKLLETEPGRHAHAIGDALYFSSGSIGEERCRLLTMAQTYLETLAIAELKRAEPWAEELARKG